MVNDLLNGGLSINFPLAFHLYWENASYFKKIDFSWIYQHIELCSKSLGTARGKTIISRDPGMCLQNERALRHSLVSEMKKFRNKKYLEGLK